MKMKRFLTMFLAVTLLFTALPNVGNLVSAADGGQVSGNNTILQGKEIDTIYGSAVEGSDGEVYYEGSFTAVNYKNGSYTTDKTNRFKCKELIGVDSSGHQTWLYCVEKNSKFSRDGYESTNAANSNYLKYGGTLSTGLNKLAKDKKISGLDGDSSIDYILLATIYGWQPDATMPTELKNQGLNDWDWYFGTQVIIWEFQQGIRQSPTQRNGNGFNAGNALFEWVDGRPAEYAYNYVIKMMAQHYTVPSFTKRLKEQAQTYTLKWNSTNKRYELTLPDTAGYAFNLKFDDSNIKCTKNGDKYTIYTTKTIPSAVMQGTQKAMNISGNQELLVWGTPGKQTMISGMQDPVEFYMKIKTELPTITIKKTGSSSADIANRTFHVYKDGSTTACLKLTTDANGNASGSLPGEGSYKVVEQNTSKYNVTYTINGTNTQTFTYPAARDANNNVTVNVKNTPKNGTLQLKKESEDGIVQGLQFKIEGNGTTVTGTTNASGYLVVNGSTNISLKPGSYTITEINTPERYEQPASISVVIKPGETVVKTVRNTNVDSKLKIIKTSEDGIVSGLMFRITGTTVTGKTVDITAATDENGLIEMEMEQGTYTVSEINTPDRYYVPTSQTIKLEDADGEVAEFYNELKPAKLQIKKTSEDGTLVGFKFQVTGNNFTAVAITNHEGYAVFGAGAYIVETPYEVGEGCSKIVVITKNMTIADVLNDLNLDPDEYYITNGRGSTYTDTTAVSSLNSAGYDIANTFVNDKAALGIYHNDIFYAAIVFQGSTYFGTGTYGVYNPSNTTKYGDIVHVNQVLNKTFSDVTGTDALYIAAFDIDRDGVVEQSDADIMLTANSLSSYVIEGATVQDLKAGKYQVTELNVPSRYAAGFDQTITLEPATSGEVTVVKVHNLLKTSGVKILKVSDDNIVEGVQFRISGTTTAGKSVNMTVTTDANGLIMQKLDYGTYTITELNVPSRYVAPASQTVTLSTQDYVEVKFENKLANGRITIIKESEDGTVGNIQFRVQSIATTSGEVIDKKVRTGSTGIATVTVPEGTYVITEIVAPEWHVWAEPQVVEVKAGDLTTAKVTFVNTMKIPHLKIVKTSDDGIVEGLKFRVKGTEWSGKSFDQTYTTDANGVIAVDIPQGTYTVSEVNTPSRYITPASQSVTLKNDETTTVYFHNTLVTGLLEIKKTSDDGKVANIPFQITGMGADGIEVDVTLKTNANGVISTDLKPGTYTVTELLDDATYVIQEPQTVEVAYGKTTTVSFQNVVKKFQLSLTKADGSTEFGIPAKSGAMQGAVYGIYKEDGTLLKSYTTDKNGKFTTEAIPCEAAYVQEITAPDGYILDDTQYWLKSSVEDCFEAVTNLSLDVVDYPVRGAIHITKKKGISWDHADSEYEAGAVFQIYPKSAGSYENANEWERDLLTTDEASEEIGNTGELYTGGEAGSKYLPLGTYIVHQVSGAEGCMLAEDIEVEITEEETVISLEILNLAITQDEFPFTGGSGITPYIVGSILVMLMAVVVAVSTKKKGTV